MNKITLFLLVLAVTALACSFQSDLPTPARTVDAAGTKLPTIHIEQDGNYRLMQVIGDLNVRPCAGTTCGIVRVAHDGEILRVYGAAVVTDNMELWMRVDGGWVDPNYLQAVTK